MSNITLSPITSDSGKHLINPELFSNINAIKKQIDLHGYCVTLNAVDIETIAKMRSFWNEFINKKHVSRRLVRGGLVLGEKNFLSYSDRPSECLYRNFDFLWNEPTHHLSSEICLELNRLRNVLQGSDENFGTQFNKDNYGIYVSTSLYTPGDGRLEMHDDGHSIIQFMLPLTFKGEDYSEGGLCIEDKSGNIIDIDSHCNKGSLAFFDGRCSHGVKKIQGSNVGRLSIFAIPHHFKRDARLEVLVRSSKILIKEYTDTVPLLKTIKRKFKELKRVKH